MRFNLGFEIIEIFTSNLEHRNSAIEKNFWSANLNDNQVGTGLDFEL